MAWPVFIILCGVLYYFEIFFLNDALTALVALVVSTIIIFVLRIFVPKEKQDRHRFEKTFIERFGKKHKSKALEFFETLEKRHFVSGHVCRASILGFILITKFLFRTDYLLIIAGYIVVMAISRLILKKHTLLDVLLGAVLGVVSVYFVDLLLF